MSKAILFASWGLTKANYGFFFSLAMLQLFVILSVALKFPLWGIPLASVFLTISSYLVYIEMFRSTSPFSLGRVVRSVSLRRMPKPIWFLIGVDILLGIAVHFLAREPGFLALSTLVVGKAGQTLIALLIPCLALSGQPVKGLLWALVSSTFRHWVFLLVLSFFVLGLILLSVFPGLTIPLIFGLFPAVFSYMALLSRALVFDIPFDAPLHRGVNGTALESSQSSSTMEI